MSILSGYGKFKRYVLTDSGYKLCSQWTSSNTVQFDDGNTAQTKLGAINGITDSLTSTSSNVALSAKSGKSLQDQITSLNTDILNNMHCILANTIPSGKALNITCKTNVRTYADNTYLVVIATGGTIVWCAIVCGYTTSQTFDVITDRVVKIYDDATFPVEIVSGILEPEANQIRTKIIMSIATNSYRGHVIPLSPKSSNINYTAYWAIA